MQYYDKPASEMTKLEYALIHSNWEPSKEDMDREIRRDKDKNPFNYSNLPKPRGYTQISIDLKVEYIKKLLNL